MKWAPGSAESARAESAQGNVNDHYVHNGVSRRVMMNLACHTGSACGATPAPDTMAENGTMYDFDLLVIGAGSGGTRAAR